VIRVPLARMVPSVPRVPSVLPVLKVHRVPSVPRVQRVIRVRKDPPAPRVPPAPRAPPAHKVLRAALPAGSACQPLVRPMAPYLLGGGGLTSDASVHIYASYPLDDDTWAVSASETGSNPPGP